jgi:hypothetical protein
MGHAFRPRRVKELRGQRQVEGRQLRSDPLGWRVFIEDETPWKLGIDPRTSASSPLSG